jgi:hypothetical protein
MTTSKLTIPEEQIEKLRDIRQKRLVELKKRAETITLLSLPKGQSYNLMEYARNSQEFLIGNSKELELYDYSMNELLESWGKYNINDHRKDAL